jgi:WD40 repeat protein
LKQKVQELAARISSLVVENESLKAEVAIYRRDAVKSVNDVGDAPGVVPSVRSTDAEHDNVLIRSGNGVFVDSPPLVRLEKLHELANPLCCTMSPDDTCLVTGGADSTLRFTAWEKYAKSTRENGGDDASAQPRNIVDMSALGVGGGAAANYLNCNAPVICAAVSPVLRNVVVAGTMDGRIHCAKYQLDYSSSQYSAQRQESLDSMKHGKYVRNVVWSNVDPIVATSSADGTVFIFKAEKTGLTLGEITLTRLESLHLSGPVEALNFVNEHTLACYVRGQPNLSFFDLSHLSTTGSKSYATKAEPMAMTKVSLNSGSVGSAAFDEHVSFAVMDIKVNCNNADSRFLVLATDSSRNALMDLRSHSIVRNFYGHRNDSYAQPRASFSFNGQYVYGNHQDDGSLFVWDIASSQVVAQHKHHVQPIRDLHSSSFSNVLVTTSFDKSTNVWTREAT